MSGILLPAPVTDLAIGRAEHPNEFGNRLTTLTGVGPNKPKRAALTYVPSVVASAITAFVIAYRTWFTRASLGLQPLLAALISGFFLWLGLAAARMLVHDAFDGRDLRIFFITIGHELITILVMALMIGLFGA